MIPKNLIEEDILKAIKEVDEKGIPLDRHSTKWSVLYEDNHYPPKYLISIANKFKNGEEWHQSKFSGGLETNQFLESIGFEIVTGGTQKEEFHIDQTKKEETRGVAGGMIVPGTKINNDTLCYIFKCSSQGGMRKSNITNTLVIISNHVKSIYDDRWIDNEFHYTGMGLEGNQRIDYSQNRTLWQSRNNDVELHLFEVFIDGEYTYFGQVELAGEPYQENQLDVNGHNRTVWMFPLKLLEKSISISQKDFEQLNSLKIKKAKRLSLDELKKRAEMASKKPPGERLVTSPQHDRNEYVSEYAKTRAKGICQLCETPAPFKDSNNIPFLEAHHIIWLSKGGPDTIENTVALCPNCHRRMHIINKQQDVLLLNSKTESE